MGVFPIFDTRKSEFPNGNPEHNNETEHSEHRLRCSRLVSSSAYRANPSFGVQLLHMTKSMCIAVQLRKFFFPQ